MILHEVEFTQTGAAALLQAHSEAQTHVHPYHANAYNPTATPAHRRGLMELPYPSQNRQYAYDTEYTHKHKHKYENSTDKLLRFNSMTARPAADNEGSCPHSTSPHNPWPNAQDPWVLDS
jgi:hypothetical protein